MTLTDRELDVMHVLWDRGSGTVSEVRARLQDELAYTTVLTILRTLEAKGHLRHEDEGRAHRYFPALKREAVVRTALGHVIARIFRGSPELMLVQLVSDRRLTAKQLHSFRRLLEERLEAKP